MKGAPESLEHAVFDISVKPVLTDEGYFDLAVKHPQGKNGTFEVADVVMLQSYVLGKISDFS